MPPRRRQLRPPPLDWDGRVVVPPLVAGLHGRAERYFRKPEGVRNEALDCRGYATAALHALYMGVLKLTDHVARMKMAIEGKSKPTAHYPVYRSRFMDRITTSVERR